MLTQYFWPEDFRINDVVLGLQALGHDVVVLTGKPNYPGGRLFPGYGVFGQTRERYGAVQVLRVPLVPRGGGGGLRLAINYLSFALFASLVGPLRCRGGVDAILVFEPSPVTVGIPALVMKALKRAPLLFWVQDLWPESLSATGAIRSPRVLRAVDALVRRIYAGCERVLVQSRAFIAPVAATGVPRERIVYLPNSAEALYRPLPADTPVPGAALPAGFRVMFAGNIGAAQSFETTLAAAEMLREHSSIHWIVLGEGRQFERVKEQVRSRHLESTVHLLGRRPVSEMPAWFSQADVMLVTLRKEPIFALTIPSKVQSYLACGRPVVAALDGEGARVVRESGGGLAADAEDARGLASAVLEIYRMPRDQREAMGRSGRDYYLREFDRDMLLGRLDRCMKDVAAGTFR